MKFITTLTLTTLFAFATTLAWSQGGHDREKLESMKIAFFTKKLDLSPEEAQVFWPVWYAEILKAAPKPPPRPD